MQSVQCSYLRTNLQRGNRKMTWFLASYHIWLFSFSVRSWTCFPKLTSREYDRSSYAETNKALFMQESCLFVNDLMQVIASSSDGNSLLGTRLPKTIVFIFGEDDIY